MTRKSRHRVHRPSPGQCRKGAEDILAFGALFMKPEPPLCSGLALIHLCNIGLVRVGLGRAIDVNPVGMACRAFKNALTRLVFNRFGDARFARRHFLNAER